MNELLWWFGQNTLAALLMIPCVMLACRAFRDRPAVQHLLWLVILLKLVTPPVVVWPWSVDELRSMAWSQESKVQVATLERLPAIPIPEVAEPRAMPMEPTLVPSEFAPNLEPSPPPVFVPIVADVVTETPQPTTQVQWSGVLAFASISVWLVGAIACFVSQLRRMVRYARLVRSGEIAPSHLKAEVASVASLLRMKAPVSVVVKGIASPFLWCVGATRLAWPDSMSSRADVVRSRGIIAHELAHLHRRDHWITWLELGASILWWWNPLFWFVRRQLRETAEMSCDALAIAANPESRHDYAKLLLQLSSQTSSGVPAPVLAVGAGNVASFERRLKMILSSNVSDKLSLRGALAMTVLAVIALPYWSLAQSSAEPESASRVQVVMDPADEEAVLKKPLDPLAYRDMDAALLRRWQQLEDVKDSIPETRVTTLRSAIGRFIEGLDASPFQLTQEKIAELKKLQTRGAEKAQHTASETQDFVKAVFAIHGEPIQVAFNEAPWLGTPGSAAELGRQAFGPPDSRGLRVALVCGKEEFILGDSAQLDVRLWNTGSETMLVGIGRDGPGLYPKLELHAIDRDGHKLATTLSAESQMLKDIKFSKTWQLRPGETTDVYGYRIRIGSGTPREVEWIPQWYTHIEIPDVKNKGEIFLTGTFPALTASAQPSLAKMQTDSIKIGATAPEQVEVWSARGAGVWPMPDSVTLEVKRDLFHGADVATSVVLTWPQDATGTTHAFTSFVASDAFGNREPWHVAWERESKTFWTMKGDLGDRGTGLPKPFSVNRIDFSAQSKIFTTTWYHKPGEMPDGIRLAFEKVFQPLPATPRRVSEAEGSVQVEQAHDVRPIDDLLHGVWTGKSNDVDVRLTFPDRDTDGIQWTVDFGQGIPVVEAKLSRINYPANNSIRLRMQPSNLSNFDEKDIVGNVRRGPDSSLLLDVVGTSRYPEYKKVIGIVLTQKPVAETKVAVPSQNTHGPVKSSGTTSDADRETVAGSNAAVLMLPAKHKEVAIAFNGGTALFDLDKGNKLGAMARGVPSDAPQFDLFATWRGPSQTQLNAQVRKLLRVDDAQWESATAESISAALKQQADARPKDQQVLANPDNPTSTWIVQTKQGGVAILKVEYRKDILTNTSGIVEGFIVRYKLAATAHETSAPAANANSVPWGDEFNGLQCRIVPVAPSMDAGQVDMSTPWTRFESPDEITFAIEIKNVSGKPIKLKDIRYGTGYADETKIKLNSNHYAPHLFDFAFTDRDGQAIARSQREFTLDSHAMILSNALLTEVEPNQSLKFLLQPAKFERSMDYRLSAGDYKVQVHYRGPSPEVQKWIETHYVGREPENAWQNQVTSNSVAFSIAADSHRQPELVWGAEKDGLQAALEIRASMDSGIPTRDPGVAATTQLVPIVHVKNVSEKTITLTSETGRQGDQLYIKTKAGKDVDIKDKFLTGWPIDVRWTLQPGDVAELGVLTPSLQQELPPGEYTVRYNVRFNSRQSKDEQGNQTFPTPGDYQSEILTGWCPLFLRDPNLQSAE